MVVSSSSTIKKGKLDPRRRSAMNEELDIYQKVAQFLINVRTNKPREIICHAIILGVLVDAEGELGVNQIVAKIQEKWKIKVPPERVSKSLKSLANSRDVEKKEGRYFMNDLQREHYRQSIQNRVSFFEEVEQDWIEAMQRVKKCRKLSDTEKAMITKDFRNAISGLCDKHASRIVNFLSGAATELEHTFVGKEILDCLPTSVSRPAEILSIEKDIFPLFFQSGDDKRAKYVAGITQTYIRRTIFEVETEGHEIFEAKMKPLNVYLDTNMIFSLLGLDGSERQEIAEHIVSMNRNLGMNTLVDQRSIQEFRSVLQNSKIQNIGLRIPKGIFAEVKKSILEPRYKPEIEFVLPDDSFTLLFWASLDEDFVKTATRREILHELERFLIHLEAVDIILSVKYEVKIVEDSQRFVPDSDVLQQTAELVLEAANKRKVRKTQTTAEHDAIMFFVIIGQREQETPEFLPSNYWLLSADRSLKEFYRRMQEDGMTNLAHFMPIASWMELITPFLTIQLVDESDDAVIVAKSLGEAFEYFEVHRMPPREVGEVLRRVPETYERGPELILRCAADRHFRETVHAAVSVRRAAKKEEIDEAVRGAFDAVKDKAELADKDLAAALKLMEGRQQELKGDLEQERTGRKRAEKELEKWKQRLRQMILAIILLVPAASIAYVAYVLTTPQFWPFTVSAAIWMIASTYLCVWLCLSVRNRNTTPRTLACTFLIAPIIFMVPLFGIHWGNIGASAILVMILMSILSLEVYLIKTSWLDVRIMWRLIKRS